MPGTDANVDQETLHALDEAFKDFVSRHDQTMGKVWNETKTVRQHIESAVYYWEDKVEGCEANVQQCYDAAAAHGGGDCSREEWALQDARQQLAEAQDAQEKLRDAELLMEQSDKDYRYFLENDVWLARRFLQQKAAIVERYRKSATAGGSSSAARARPASNRFERSIVDGALAVAGSVALGTALAVIAVKEIQRRRNGLVHTPASGARDVAALVGDGQFVADPVATTSGSGAFAAVYAEPTSGLLLASRTIPVSPQSDTDAQALLNADPEGTYRMAVIADPGNESGRRLFGRGEDGAWLEILPDPDDDPTEYPDDEAPPLPDAEA